MVSTNQQKIGDANGMPSLPTCAHTGHVKREMWVLWTLLRMAQLFTFGPRGQGISVRGS